MEVTIEELREICKQYIGSAMFTSFNSFAYQVPAALAELETCSNERVIEIAESFGIIKGE